MHKSTRAEQHARGQRHGAHKAGGRAQCTTTLTGAGPRRKSIHTHTYTRTSRGKRAETWSSTPDRSVMALLFSHSVRTLSQRGQPAKSAKPFLSNTSVSSRVKRERFSRELREGGRQARDMRVRGHHGAKGKGRGTGPPSPRHPPHHSKHTIARSVPDGILRQVQLLGGGAVEFSDIPRDLHKLPLAEVQGLRPARQCNSVGEWG